MSNSSNLEHMFKKCKEANFVVYCQYVERRTLVADVMGALVSYIEEDMRCSLVISILEQLCSDGEAEVRHAALISLISVLNNISGLDKYRVVSNIFVVDIAAVLHAVQ